jgi:hypothetical protein
MRMSRSPVNHVIPSRHWTLMKVIRSLCKSFLFWVLITAILTGGIGEVIGCVISETALQDQTCAPSAEVSSWKNINISALPDTLGTSFGYGRGTQVIESTLNATPQAGAKLPTSISVFAQPLVSSDGTKVIQSLSASTSQSEVGISAVAIREGGSPTYQLEVCIRAPKAASGSYSSQLLFPGATIATGTGLPVAAATSVPVTVTFQSETVPYILTVGLAPLTLGGMLYCALILIRRNNPALTLGEIDGKIKEALLSVNGMIALLLGVAAVFTAWNIQCYRDLTWGTPWPTILVALTTMAGAAAGASTVSLGLATGIGALVANPRSLNVQKGGQCTVGISLPAAPLGNVTVTTTATSGNSGLSVTAGKTLTYTPSNFSIPQDVTITASNSSTGSAKFTVSAPGYTSTTIAVTAD